MSDRVESKTRRAGTEASAQAVAGRIVAIGPPDTVLGLGLLGIEGLTADTLPEARHALDRALSAPGVALVLLTRTWSEAMREQLEHIALDESGPLVVEIPDPDAEEEDTSLAQHVERVLGVRLDR